jgi:hypothetical protein
MDRIDRLPEREAREFFKAILDAAERSLRGILFMASEEFKFRKKLTKEEIGFWLRKVSLALVAYSYYFFSVPEGEPPSVQLSYDMHWQKILDSYNAIFDVIVTMNDINYYAAGLKEDTEKKYTASGDMKKTEELMVKDYRTIGDELLQGIWQENVEPNEKEAWFIGVRIWQAYQQIVQPFLSKLITK